MRVERGGKEGCRGSSSGRILSKYPNYKGQFKVRTECKSDKLRPVFNGGVIVVKPHGCNNIVSLLYHYYRGIIPWRICSHGKYHTIITL